MIRYKEFYTNCVAHLAVFFQLTLEGSKCYFSGVMVLVAKKVQKTKQNACYLKPVINVYKLLHVFFFFFFFFLGGGGGGGGGYLNLVKTKL